MTTEEHVALHDSQIRRLERVMTALAEAQVRVDDQLVVLSKTQAETATELKRFTQTQAESHAKVDAQLGQVGETMNQFSHGMIELRDSLNELAKAQARTEQHLQAYITTRPKN